MNETIGESRSPLVEPGGVPAAGAAPVVTVFGGSRVERDTPAYREAYEVGRLLAGRGYVVCNGGYSGTMEAVSRGCKEAGGRTIGVTVEVLGWQAPNEYLDEEVGTASLLLRLDKLTALADAYVVLGGSVGTLLELALVWNLHLLRVYDKPIILLGPDWRAAVEALAQHLLIGDLHLDALAFADSPADVTRLLRERGVVAHHRPEVAG
jgi:uncharacterized protein (TIGR00730 family)